MTNVPAKRERSREEATREIDDAVLESLGNFELWKGPRAMTGAGYPAVRSAELTEVLALDINIVAASLERLRDRGRVRTSDGTFDNPSPQWFILPL